MPTTTHPLEPVLRRYRHAHLRLARQYVDERDAEDVVQDAYLQAVKCWPTFRGDAKMTTWLYRIVLNSALLVLRRQSRRSGQIGEELEQLADASHDDYSLADRCADQQALPRAADAFLQRRRDSGYGRAHEKILRDWEKTLDAMVDIYAEGMSYAEAAEEYNIPISTLKPKLFRARQELRENLVEMGY